MRDRDCAPIRHSPQCTFSSSPNTSLSLRDLNGIGLGLKLIPLLVMIRPWKVQILRLLTAGQIFFLIPNISTLKNSFFLRRLYFYFRDFLACMYVCVLCVCLLPIEVRRGHGFPGTLVTAESHHAGAGNLGPL